MKYSDTISTIIASLFFVISSTKHRPQQYQATEEMARCWG